jgi:hypothetical protein
MATTTGKWRGKEQGRTGPPVRRFQGLRDQDIRNRKKKLSRPEMGGFLLEVRNA